MALPPAFPDFTSDPPERVSRGTQTPEASEGPPVRVTEDPPVRMTEATNTEIVETVEQWTITDDVDLPVSSMEGTNTDDVDRPVSVMDDGHGTTAPMSAPDRLPPAFAEYDRRGIPETNPFEEFMTNEDYVALDDTGAILLDDLRDLYNTYLQDHGRRASVRWSEDVYMTSLTKRQLHVSRPSEITIDGCQHTNRNVVVGLTVSPMRRQGGPTRAPPVRLMLGENIDNDDPPESLMEGTESDDVDPLESLREEMIFDIDVPPGQDPDHETPPPPPPPPPPEEHGAELPYERVAGGYKVTLYQDAIRLAMTLELFNAIQIQLLRGSGLRADHLRALRDELLAEAGLRDPPAARPPSASRDADAHVDGHDRHAPLEGTLLGPRVVECVRSLHKIGLVENSELQKFVRDTLENAYSNAIARKGVISTAAHVWKDYVRWMAHELSDVYIRERAGEVERQHHNSMRDWNRDGFALAERSTDSEAMDPGVRFAFSLREDTHRGFRPPAQGARRPATAAGIGETRSRENRPATAGAERSA